MAFLAVDLSNNNADPMNLGAAKAAGIQLMVHKASEGLGFFDARYGVRMSAARAAEIHRMSYHFGRPDSDPIKQAHYAVHTAQFAYGPYSTGVLDLEVGDGDLSSWALAFLREFHLTSGRKPWMYSTPSFIQAHLHDPALADYALWLASWVPFDPHASVDDLVEQSPLCPAPWTLYSMWQHTDQAIVPGIPGPVDRSVFLGTPSQFELLH